MKTTFTKADVEEFILRQDESVWLSRCATNRQIAVETFDAFWTFLKQKEQPPEITEAIKLLESNGYKVKK